MNSRFLFLASTALLLTARAEGAGPDTSSLKCPEGMKPAVYDTPQEGTKPWQGKQVRCEKETVTCPPLMAPVYYDTEVYGSAPSGGRFVRCEEKMPSAATPGQ